MRGLHADGHPEEAVGLGRAALLAVDEDPEQGLVCLAEALALETRLSVSALGKYSADMLTPDDVLLSGTSDIPVPLAFSAH